MPELRLKYLVRRKGKPCWWCKYKHPCLNKRPIYNSTGIPLTDIAAAAKYSNAITTFITDKTWHNIAKRPLGEEIHKEAARCFYAQMKVEDNGDFAAQGLYVCRPYQYENGEWDDQLAKIEETLREAEIIRGENGVLKARVAELEVIVGQKDARLQRLEKEINDLQGKGKSTKPFSEAAREYQAWGNLQGGRNNRPWSKDHSRKREEHLAFWAEKFPTLGDIDLTTVESVLSELKSSRSGKTVNNYAECLNGLITWAIKHDHLSANPLVHYEPLDATPETTKRALTPEEIDRLLKNCVPTRKIVYQTALCSGLRANELRSLKISDLDKEKCGLRLRAEWTKNRKKGFQVLPRWLVDELAVQSFGRPADDLLLPSMPVDTSDTFEVDRLAANIPKKDANGDVVSFHALRVSFVSMVDRTGASEKTTQQAARHAPGSALTFGRYAKAQVEELGSVAEAVGEMVRAG